MSVDFPGNFYSLPPGFEDCLLCPDLVVWNSKLGQVLVFQLTIPLEENIANAASIKSDQYEPLRELFIKSGW